MSPDVAITQARTKGLDLVEVAPTSSPPVCRILDYGKYVYEQNKKQQEARKKQRHIHLKEVKFRPKTDAHDYEFKKKHIDRFLRQGDKVKVVIMFRGREMQYLDRGRRILDRVRDELKEIAVVEFHPKMEGRSMSMILNAKKGLAAADKTTKGATAKRGTAGEKSEMPQKG
jgi:translation initiation factor IF-3